MGRFIAILSITLLLIFCYGAAGRSQPPNLSFCFDAEGNRLDGMPPALAVFNAYLILKDAPYEVTGVEFQLLTPQDPSHILLMIVDFSFPQESTLCLGDPFSGMSIAYWPPLDGFTHDHLLLCTLQCFLLDPCTCNGGTITDFPIVAGPHPDTGELRGTYAPDHEMFSMVGFTSVMCPQPWWPLLCNVIVTAEDEITAAFCGCTAISDASAEDESRYLVIEQVSPSDTLAVIHASRHTSHAVRLKLERPMMDRTNYLFVATNICEEFDCACSDHEFEYYFSISIGTVLESFSAEQTGDGIVITWRMAEIGEGVGFRVLRDEDDRGMYTDIHSPAIAKEGLEFRFIDRNAAPGHAYRYRIEYIDNGEPRLLFETEPVAVPALALTLRQNIPNPFNPSTTIRYYLPETAQVTLAIYDTAGREVVRLVDTEQPQGPHMMDWNGRDNSGIMAASGVYFCRLTAGKKTITRKMILLK